ncbi:MAG: hypothetical protein SCM96_09390 [Acidobacteriota bacterium]|nr:hypothetical protein [Acidobacteriota bacterium]
MKKSRWLPVVLIALSGACALESTRVLRFDLPVRTPVQLEAFDHLAILGFREAEPLKDFEARKELSEHLAYEFGLRLPDKVTRKNELPDKEAAFDDPDLWKDAEAGNTLFLTGTVRFTEETRKALSLDEREIDGPFKSEASGFRKRKLFTLTSTLVFIDADTGKIVFQREFKEVKAYENVRQPAEFAFHELAVRMRVKLFAALFGEERPQERTLLLRD